MRRALVFAASLAVVAPAAALRAHAVFDRAEAQAGGYYTGFLRIGHGCGMSPTTSVRVAIPDTVLSARPQPKPGWTLTIETAPLPAPVPAEGGGVQTERVTAITWTGLLPIDQFDQFGLSLKLPDAAGPLNFPTIQRCTAGENAWTQIAVPGGPCPARPAPMIMLSAGGEEMHAGH